MYVTLILTHGGSADGSRAAPPDSLGERPPGPDTAGSVEFACPRCGRAMGMLDGAEHLLDEHGTSSEEVALWLAGAVELGLQVRALVPGGANLQAVSQR